MPKRQSLITIAQRVIILSNERYRPVKSQLYFSDKNTFFMFLDILFITIFSDCRPSNVNASCKDKLFVKEKVDDINCF